MSDYKGKYDTPWSELNIKFMNQRIPRGWYTHCEVTLEKYTKACEDWRIIAEKSYEDSAGVPDEKKMVTVLRMRLRGPAKDTVEQ